MTVPAVAEESASASAPPPAKPAFAPLSLAAASNFSQGWGGRQSTRFAAATRALGVTDLRDGMNWRAVEADPGRYTFDQPRTAFPDALSTHDLGMSVTLSHYNPLYDNAETPHSAAALAAHARYAAALIARFPAIHTIEVGNEFNGNTFVKGPVRETRGAARAAAHVAILKPVYDAVKAQNPDIKILGGAAHSIPAAYLWEVLDAGGAAAMDALVVHPYTTRPEEFGAQIDVLRRHPDARALPIEVTEFGTKDAHRAPSDLIKWVAVMAVNGVERAVWYPLNARGDGYAALLDDAFQPTAAGRAFQFASAHLAGRHAVDVSPGPHTFAIRFGEDTLVLWGEARTLNLAATVQAFDAQGVEQPTEGLVVDPDQPLILIGDGPIALGQTVRLGPNGLVADSYTDFSYPQDGADRAGGSPVIERFVRQNGEDLELATMPGQERPATPWTPYLSRDGLYPLRLNARVLMPRAGARAADVVHRYTAETAGDVAVYARFEPSEQSSDGITITVLLNGTPIVSADTREPAEFDERFFMDAGDTIAFVVGAGASHKGDHTHYRIRIGAPDSAVRAVPVR